MAKTFVFVNQKGGVGKTTSAICNAIKNHKCVYGYHWKYVNEVNENTPNSENII